MACTFNSIGDLRIGAPLLRRSFFRAVEIVASAVHCFHGTYEIRFPPIQVSSEGVGATPGDRRCLFEIHFAHEIGDLVFFEVAVDKIEGLFGNEQIIWICRVQGLAEGRKLHPPNTLLPREILNYSWVRTTCHRLFSFSAAQWEL